METGEGDGDGEEIETSSEAGKEMGRRWRSGRGWRRLDGRKSEKEGDGDQ
jgi:hypothetical protein